MRCRWTSSTCKRPGPRALWRIAVRLWPGGRGRWNFPRIVCRRNWRDREWARGTCPLRHAANVDAWHGRRRAAPSVIFSGLIGIGLLHQVQSAGSHIADVDEPGVPHLPLHIGAPLLDEGVSKVKLERAHAGVARAPNVGEGILNDGAASGVKPCPDSIKGKASPMLPSSRWTKGGLAAFWK